MKMNSNSANSSKRNKSRTNMPMSQSVHTSQKTMNRNMGRNSNGQAAVAVVSNHYHNQSAHSNASTHNPQQSLNNNSSNKYQNSNISSNNNNDDNSSVNDCIDIVNSINGVYKNSRLMHAVTSLIGCLVEVELTGGEAYEGVLQTFSPEFDLVLASATPLLKDVESNEKFSALTSNVSNLVCCLEQKHELTENMVIKQKNVVKFKALNVDLDYATKKSCLIDAEIASKADYKNKAPKDLVPWCSDGDDGDLYSIDDESNGNSIRWNPSDMLEYNETKFNINSTYKEEMPEYTIQLNPRDDDEYRQLQQHAEQIARDIEKDPARMQRVAKENDQDEETRFSAVVSSKRDVNSNLPSNVSSPRSEISHSSSREDRRDPMRANQDNSGFRTQSSRPNRNNRGPGSGGGNRNSATNENWRSRDGQNNSPRFNNANLSYNNFNSKSNNPSSGGNSGGGGGYGSTKYSSGGNVPSNQYASSGPKSYSAVSARNTVNDSLATENDSKQFANRPQPNKSEHYQNDGEAYNRKSVSSGTTAVNVGSGNVPQSQREFKSRVSRNVEQEPVKLTTQVPLSKPELDVVKEPSANSTSVVVPTASANSPVPSNESSQLSAQQKVPSHVKPDSSNNQQLAKFKSVDEGQQLQTTTKILESKKQEPPLSQTIISPQLSGESIKQEVEVKKESSPVASVITVQPNVTLVTSTVNVENSGPTSPPGSASSAVSNNDLSGGVKSSTLNPNAKAFTPRQSSSVVNNPVPQFIPQNAMVPNFYNPQPQHISTTPPSGPSMPNQYTMITPHIASQHHHQHPHQPQAHLRNTYSIHSTFPTYNLIPQMMPQYIMSPMGPSGMPPPVFSGPVPTGVPATVAPNQASGPNQSGPGGQMSTHHMVTNASGPPQNQTQQPQVASTRNQYNRPSNKGGSNHGSGPNQQSQQYISRQPHHPMPDYSQQSQVANVTGQPIMATNVQQASIPAAYSNAASVHGAHHHHHQSQQHGQQSQGLGPNPMAPQPGPTQGLAYQMFVPSYPNRIGLLHQNQLPMYDQTLICDCPSMVSAQQISNAVPQNNLNMQSNASNIPSSVPSNNTPNANQVSQGAPPQQAY